mmetsp:Transcript_4667/g.9703  ORF Transcript_4667/g.9703 Transcript_4667/m.9703 type:complete len:519 (+) Transcript_4667:32-1588(+)
MATSLRSLCVSIALLALALAAQSKKNEDLITSLGSITRRHMDASSGFSSTQEYLQSVASARRPLVVTGYDVDLSKWDLDALAKKGGGGVILDNVRRNRGSKSVFAIMTPEDQDSEGFVLRKNTTLGGLETSDTVSVITPNAENLLFNVDFNDFYAIESGPDGSMEKLYWTGDLRGVAGDSLGDGKGDLWWRDFQVWDDLQVEGEVGEEVFVPMLWMSHPGVTAQTHYDKSHNWFLQLFGTKKIRLFPPSYGRYMYSYPSVHAGRKMSQIPFLDSWGGDDPTKGTIFPNATSLKSYDMLLKPGEILYIPPYWWHSISTTDESAALSLSVVSPSWEEALVSRAVNSPLPLRPFESKVEKRVAAQVIITHVVSRMEKMGSPEIFSAFLFNDRWANLYPSLGGRRGECYGWSDGEEEEVEEVMGRLQEDEELQGDIVAAAEAVAGLLNDELLSQGVRMVALGDWIEKVAVWAVAERQGEGEPVAKFLLDCLGVDNLEITEQYDGKPLVEDGDGRLNLKDDEL